MPALVSSNLAFADYDVETRDLAITFHSGKTYSYSGVDQVTYDDLIASNSPGSYFARQIKGRFPERRV